MADLQPFLDTRIPLATRIRNAAQAHLSNAELELLATSYVDEIEALDAEIHDFHQQCAAEEYTDTDAVWTLFERLRLRLTGKRSEGEDNTLIHTLEERQHAAAAMPRSLDAILEDAQDAFWNVIAKHVPTQYGDFGPEETEAFDDACRRAATQWIWNNVPFKQYVWMDVLREDGTDGSSIVGFPCILDEDERWNGWACPAFTKDQAMLWLKYQNINAKTQGGMFRCEYDPQRNAFIAHDDENMPGEPQIFEADENGLYQIGAYCWTWNAYNDHGLNEYTGLKLLDIAKDA